jgi:hypothetical protein
MPADLKINLPEILADCKDEDLTGDGGVIKYLIKEVIALCK